MAARNYSAASGERTLSNAVNSTAPTITLSSGGGFPAPPFTMVLDPDTASQEVVLATAVSGNNYTVQRGYDGTAAVPHGAGAKAFHVHSAIDFREANQHIQAASGVHGVGAGEVVGTAKTQALTNKTINLASNSLTGDISQFNSALSGDNFATEAALAGVQSYAEGVNLDLSNLSADVDDVRGTHAALEMASGWGFSGGNGDHWWSAHGTRTRITLTGNGSDTTGQGLMCRMTGFPSDTAGVKAFGTMWRVSDGARVSDVILKVTSSQWNVITADAQPLTTDENELYRVTFEW